MNRVFLVGACRTPIGKMGGILSGLSAVELGAIVIREVIGRARISAAQVDYVYMGCVIQAGLGQNVARQAAVLAGLPYETTAETLNSVCGSSLDCISSAARMIQLGDADIIVAGGTESMSNAPFAIMNARFGYRLGYPAAQSNLVDTMVNDGLWDSFNDCHMGITAEAIADRWHLTRKQLDTFAVESQRKACCATDRGEFSEEIVPICVTKKHETVLLTEDEGLRRDISLKGLAGLKPAFKTDGIVTAGNSSGLNDGAAAVLLVSESKLLELGIDPLAEYIGGTLAGVDPIIMGIGPVASTRKLMERYHLSIEDFDLIEMNEAFASQSIVVADELKLDMDRLNVNGGAIALGHPIGASGCRILVTLLHAMKKRGAYMGLASLCIGGGMGCSVAVRRTERC